MNFRTFQKGVVLGVAVLAICALSVPSVLAQVPGGTLNPLTIPKYVTPLVIPPVMNNAGAANDYDIAVRQFQQQILPGGIWNTINGRADAFGPTTVWSYGPASDSAQIVAPDPTSQFNYPAYTIENTVNTPTTVDWINDLKDPVTGVFLPHLLPVDQTLHWANPGADCVMGPARTDCRGTSSAPYQGPVPIVTHVHGSHTVPNSDGYPEAWWLPDPTGSNFTCVPDPADADPANGIYVCEGTIANKYGLAPNTNATPGVGNYSYANDQPSTTLWYHDHTLGMTRNNVYAGPAGFWLIREAGGGETGLQAGKLPAPAPVSGQTVLQLNVPTNPIRQSIREIPIVIQDRSFDIDPVTGNPELFYPDNRAFFEGLNAVVGGTAVTPQQFPGAPNLLIPFIGDTNGLTTADVTPAPAPSDISPIWNPEAFFNVMVVNGVSWPVLEVAPALYRFRLLNGCNSRFLNLALFQTNRAGNTVTSRELPFYQIGAEQSLLPQVVMIQTGFATPLNPAVGIPKKLTKAAHKDQALLMGLAERADVIVDFRGLANGARIRMVNTAPDAPFGGFPDVPADPATTGQVMEFVVNTTLAIAGGPYGASPTDPVNADGTPNATTAATNPWQLVLGSVDPADPAATLVLAPTTPTRPLALIEEESVDVCVTVSPNGTVTYIPLLAGDMPFDPLDPANPCFAAGGIPFAPKAAVLGTYDPAALGAVLPNVPWTVTLWSDPIVTNPALDATEAWDIANFTVDGHPIHLHLVKFMVKGRRALALGTTPGTLGTSVVPGNGVQPWENGWKDTVIAYPGEVTTVAATFDIAGLYVWHCHIVEHEDNEMMVPYCVGDPNANGCAGL